jgi:hypothetical protein
MPSFDGRHTILGRFPPLVLASVLGVSSCASFRHYDLVGSAASIATTKSFYVVVNGATEKVEYDYLGAVLIPGYTLDYEGYAKGRVRGDVKLVNPGLGSAPELRLSPSSTPSSYDPAVASATLWHALPRHRGARRTQADLPRWPRSPVQVRRYFSPYLSADAQACSAWRSAIAACFSPGTAVCFTYRDYAAHTQDKKLTLPAPEFLRRFPDVRPLDVLLP